MRTLSSHHAAFLAKFRCSLYRGLSTSILSVTFSASKPTSTAKHSATPDDRQVPSCADKCDKHSATPDDRQVPSRAVQCVKKHSATPPDDRQVPSRAVSRATKHSATLDDRQVTSRAVKCDETFRHSRRSSSAFSRSEPPVKRDKTLLH